jgi:hypothetical protein
MLGVTYAEFHERSIMMCRYAECFYAKCYGAYPGSVQSNFLRS